VTLGLAVLFRTAGTTSALKATATMLLAATLAWTALGAVLGIGEGGGGAPTGATALGATGGAACSLGALAGYVVRLVIDGARRAWSGR
jgi:hypothetical protein